MLLGQFICQSFISESETYTVCCMDLLPIAGNISSFLFFNSDDYYFHIVKKNNFITIFYFFRCSCEYIWIYIYTVHRFESRNVIFCRCHLPHLLVAISIEECVFSWIETKIHLTALWSHQKNKSIYRFWMCASKNGTHKGYGQITK